MTFQILKASFDLLHEKGWKSFEVSDLANRLTLPLSEILSLLPYKSSLMPLLHQHIETTLYASLSQEDILSVPPKDRLFELLLLRFELLEPFKPGLLRLSKEIWCDPRTVIEEGIAYHTDMEKLLKFAGLSTEGPIGFLKTKVLVGVYLAAFKTWLQDPTPPLEKTMAFLDRHLTWCDLQMQKYV